MRFTGAQTALVVELVADGRVDLSAWRPGPFPFDYIDFESGRRGVTDASLRSSYFHRRTANAVYGTPDRQARWHRVPEVGTILFPAASGSTLQCGVDAVELLQIPDEVGGCDGLLVAHLDLDLAAPLEALHRSSRVGAPDQPSRAWMDDLLGGTGLRTSPSARRAGSVSFFVPEMSPTSDNFDLMLRLVAGATTADRYYKDPEQPAPVPTWLSSSWRCLVQRDSFGFVARTAAGDDEFVSTFAPVLAKTLYTDAFLIATMQRLAFNDLADEMSEANWSDGISRLRDVERRLSVIRNSVWGSHLTDHETANEILRVYTEQRRLPELVDEVQAELDGALRVAAFESGRRVEALLTVLTVVASVAALAQVLTDAGGAAFSAVLAVSALLIGLMLWLRSR